MQSERLGIKFIMTKVRLDKVQFFSNLETYLNNSTLKSNIVASGVIPANSGVIFATGVNFVSGRTRTDSYARNLGTGIKMPIIGGARVNPYTPVAGIQASLTSSSDALSVSARLLLFNTTGAPINVGSQTLEISVVVYNVPLIA